MTQIERYRPAYRDQLLNFLTASFPEAALKADPAYFSWRFEQNPLGTSAGDCYVVLTEGRVVGFLGALRDRVWANGKWQPCLWLVDLILAPPSRGGLAVLRLFQRAMADHPLVLTVGATQDMARLYSTLGWDRLAGGETFVCPMRPRRMAALSEQGDRHPSLRRAGPVLPLLEAVLPGIMGVLTRPRRASPLNVATSDALGPEVAELLERLVPRLGVTNFRDVDQLRWKFAEGPRRLHRNLLARDARSRCCGYAVVKLMSRGDRLRWVEVADIVTDPDDVDAFRTLTRAAVRQAIEWRADFARVRVSAAEQVRQLRPPVWVRRTMPVSDEVFVHCVDPTVAQQLRTAPWYLTSFASDRVDYGADECPIVEAGRS